MSFGPVAIVGRGCVFPGALDCGALWELIAGNRDAISSCPDNRWRIPKESVLGDRPEGSWTDRAGYVTGFEHIFDPSGFAIPESAIRSYDETLAWVLHTAREALREAGIAQPALVPRRTGAVLGLLGLPSESMAQYAEQIWTGAEPAISPANRFSTGLPAHVLAEALRLDLGAFALDAACASSLYAIKVACDELNDGRADLMLAGGVNRADDLFLHIGFSTLKAVSRSGLSRPFHAAADGLLPAEGAGFVALKRLADAEAAGDRVLAVIRGIGVSNDGRAAGLLTPSEEGQEHTMRLAYASAGVEPATVSLIECHATGTAVGDACEIRSTAKLFDGLRDVPVGSVKSNLGHPMTAAGMAGLLKLIGAIQARTRPASLHVESAAETIGSLRGSPFRLLRRNEPWDAPGTRRAALSAFGFGGNNAHLIVEECGADARRSRPVPVAGPKVAVVAMGVSAGDTTGVDDFTRALFQGEARAHRMESISLDMDRLGFPPADLAAALPQQILALQAASEALESAPEPARSKTGVFVGMGCDAEVARYGLRWRAAGRQEVSASEADAICPPLTAPAVIGRLSNMAANRISSKYDFRGPSFAVMAEELSGVVALRLAARALSSGEIDAAVVGAVDLSCERVHETAARAMLPPEKQVAGDGAVFFVLKRLEEAGQDAMAVFDASEDAKEFGAASAASVFGHAHAASGLMESAAAVLACTHGAVAPARPWISPGERAAGVRISALGGASGRVGFSAPQGRSTRPLLLDAPPRLALYSGEDRRAVLAALRSGEPSGDGPAKLAIVAAGEEDMALRRERAQRALEGTSGAFALDGIYFRPAPVGGQLAFVFPGAAAAYRGMGRTLLLAFPELLDKLATSWPQLTAAAAWVFETESAIPSPTEKLWGSSLLSQAHADFALRLLGLRPDAAIGISSGETNSLAALAVWRDLDRFYEEFTAAGALDRVLGGAFEITGGSKWAAWQVRAPRHQLEEALARAPGLRVTGIFAPDEYSVAGEESACARAMARLRGASQALNYDLVIHCGEFAPYAEAWRTLHDRECFASPVHFYTHGGAKQYTTERAAVAEALTRQALAPLDFPALIEQAWNDGVRIFLEQGPQGASAARIRRILGDREHAAIPMDLAGSDSLRQAANAAAQLIVAGVRGVNTELFARLEPRPKTAPRKWFSIPAHADPVTVVRRRPRTTTVFEQHARAVAASYAGLLEQSGAAQHERFLETAQRAYLQLATRLTTPAKPAGARQFTRSELETLSSGSIATVFGPEFQPLDSCLRVVRLPEPPLLLVDRVTRLEGRALSMAAGRIVTETDVRADAWYMYRGRMPAGVMIEAGQADLLLISWLGIDFEVRGNRVYRLLGCDLTYHGELPRAGETLQFDIKIDRHARQGDVRLFFFHYDCRVGDRVRLSVRNGQAGFFTDEELENSAGILGAPEPPAENPQAKRYSAEQVRAAAAGRAFDSFGAGFEMAAPHQRPPGFAASDGLLIDAVPRFEPHLGEANRGYLRAELPIHPDSWFFNGHFKNDPCMPGTLMFDGCLQAMAFYMMASGLTLGRDGWRFEPAPDLTYELRCRGQVTPRSQLLVYELFVHEMVANPAPLLVADLLCTVDGLKAFHCRRMCLRLTPGNPMDDRPAIEPSSARDTGVASVNGVALDYASLLACAWGSPVDAFGPPFAKFETGRLPRLPGPPYHFVSRITRIDGEFGVERAGSSVVAEFDVDPSAWFFECSGGVMPLAVLMEIGLQPCGWLACYSGIPLRAEEDLYFRNLNGSATVHGAVEMLRGRIRTRSKLTNVARSAGITLTTFDVQCDWDGRTVFDMQTTFGFFAAGDLARQTGLPSVAGADAGRFEDVLVDLKSAPPRYCAGPLRMPSGNLLMLDRITGLGGGPDGGWVRAEKDVRPSEWFFKAHFYQDPVQPGSLGLDALVQALQFYAIHHRVAEHIAAPRFVVESPLVWKYRGQVLPTNRRIVVEVRVTGVERTSESTSLRAEGWLFVDGVRIYHFSNFGLKVVSGDGR